MADNNDESREGAADEFGDILRLRGVTLMSGRFPEEEQRDELADRRFWTGASLKIKKHQLNPTSDGQELTVETEVISAEGESDMLGSYMRWIHSGDSYVVFQHKPRSRFKEGSSVITFGRKGAVEGAYRRDRIWGLVIFHSGEIYREEPREVKVLITDPYASLTPQESLDQFLRNKPSDDKP